MICPESLSLTAQAQKYTSNDVAGFLESVGLGQYMDQFVKDDISGDILVDVKEADDKMLIETGVKSPLHRIKIVVLFKRHVQGASTR